MKERILIVGHGPSIGRTVFSQAEAMSDKVVIVDTEKQKDPFENTPTMLIRNYTLANKIVDVKTGKELRRERRKQKRK